MSHFIRIVNEHVKICTTLPKQNASVASIKGITQVLSEQKMTGIVKSNSPRAKNKVN